MLEHVALEFIVMRDQLPVCWVGSNLEENCGRLRI